MTDKAPIDILLEKGYENIIIFCNPDYTNALIGLTPTNQAVYEYELMLEWLITEEDMSLDDAIEFIDYNCSFYYGDKYPVIWYNDFYGEEPEEIDEDYPPLEFTFINDLPDLTK